MFKRFFLLALASGLFALAAFAQATGEIAITVKDALTNKGIEKALCKIGRISASTSPQGEVSVKVPAGPHTVTCSANGFAPGTKRVIVAAGATSRVLIALSAPKPVEAPASAPAEPAPAADEAVTKAPKTISVKGKKSEAVGVGGIGVVGGGSGRGYGAGGSIHPARPVKIAMRPGPPPPAMVAGEPMQAGEMNREDYAALTDNPFKAVTQDPLSTFSIDVDTASYANLRRFLNQGQLPPKDAIRIEEMINYFSYTYPDAAGEHPFTVNTEISTAPWNQKHRLVRIGIQGKKVDVSKLPPSNLVFLLDVSGSMNNHDKLPLLKQALALLVNNLRVNDRVSIVVYAGAAGLVLPSTPGSDRGTILAALESLSAGGSTAGGAGIKLAYQVARQNFIKEGNNRVILATDGDFNVGVSSDGELVSLIEEERKSGVFLTVLGFGTGNYQDAKMEQLANKGNGNAAYIDSILEAQKVLVTQMGGTLLTIAKDVKLQLEFNPAKVKGYRLIGYENRILAAQDFNDDKKDAGELGAGHSVTALYEIVPAGSPEPLPGVDELKYQKVEVAPAAQNSPELMTIKLRYKQPTGDVSQLIEHPLVDADVGFDSTSEDFRFATAVAEFGMLLRDSPYKGEASFDNLIARAKSAMGKDENGYRFDFVGLAQKAKLLKAAQAPQLKMAQ
jgi:Ca-activated chloride channel family protein